MTETGSLLNDVCEGVGGIKKSQWKNVGHRRRLNGSEKHQTSYLLKAKLTRQKYHFSLLWFCLNLKET